MRFITGNSRFQQRREEPLLVEQLGTVSAHDQTIDRAIELTLTTAKLSFDKAESVSSVTSTIHLPAIGPT